MRAHEDDELTLKRKKKRSVCAPFIGSSIFIPVPGPDNPYVGPNNETLTAEETIAVLEGAVIATIAVVQQNRVLIGENCTSRIDYFACSGNIMGCMPVDPSNVTGEGIPLLPCVQACRDWWGPCQPGFDLYMREAIVAAGISPTKAVPVNCDGGTYSPPYNQPPDKIGERYTSSMPMAFPIGYLGTDWYPVPGNITYMLNNHTNISVNCYDVVESLTTPVDLSSHAVECTEPLVPRLNSQGTVIACDVPCPVPVFTDSERLVIQNAYIVPAFFGLISCALVLLDSMWVIFETTGGFGNFRKYFGSSSVSGGTGSQISTNNAYLRQLRKTTLYSLTGALLGIVYFIIGPAATLEQRSAVSCGSVTQFDINDIGNGTADFSTNACRAQRIAPFIIQLMFNLILYSIVRIAMVVSDKLKNLGSGAKTGIEVVLVAYCLLVPLICLIITAAIDKLETDLETALGQMVRQAVLCQARILNPSAEFVLIYLPFIVTGVLVSVFSLSIFVSLRSIQEKVAGVGMKNKTASDTALRLLVIRLALLGLGTFCVLIVLMITSSLFVATIGPYTSAWFNGFTCLATAYPCAVPDCQKVAAAAESVKPPVALIATQLAAMSCIPALFGIFFLGQSLARLYKEYKDGSLQQKLWNVVHGKHTLAGTSHDGNTQDQTRSQQPIAAYQVTDGGPLSSADKTRGSNLQ